MVCFIRSTSWNVTLFYMASTYDTFVSSPNIQNCLTLLWTPGTKGLSKTVLHTKNLLQSQPKNSYWKSTLETVEKVSLPSLQVTLNRLMFAGIQVTLLLIEVLQEDFTIMLKELQSDVKKRWIQFLIQQFLKIWTKNMK